MKPEPIYYHNITQGTDEWHEIRAGHVGGSEAHALFVKGKGSILGVSAISLVYEKVGEMFTGPVEMLGNYAMQRGNELEPQARAAYTLDTFTNVDQCGYIEAGRFVGYSPDGLIGDDGLIEIKCPMAPEFARFAHTREIDPKHYAQMQWGLWITGRDWCDYVMYHPDFFTDTLIERVLPNAEYFTRFDISVPAFSGMMIEVLAKLGIQ